MIAKLALVYADGRFVLTATAERDRKIEAAGLFFAALVDLLADPRPLCEAFGIAPHELLNAVRTASDPAKLVNTPSVGGVN